MESQSWFLCLILSFGLIVLSDAQRPPYIPPPEYGRKRNAEDILQVNRLFDLGTLSVFSISHKFSDLHWVIWIKTVSCKKKKRLFVIRTYFFTSHFSVTDVILKAIWYIFFVQYHSLSLGKDNEAKNLVACCVSVQHY